MSRSALHDRSTKGHIDIVISHNGQGLSVGRVNGVQSDNILIAFIIRMNKDSLVGEHSFRTGCRDHQFLSGFFDDVLEVIHLSGNFLMNNLDIA